MMFDWKKFADEQQAPAPGKEALLLRVKEMLRSIYDPELPVNIYDLGLVYQLEATETGHINVTMTLTTPNCPVAQTFPDTVREKLLCVPGVNGVDVTLVWDPPWGRDSMSEAAKLQLGML